MRILQIHPLMKSEWISPRAGGMARAAVTLTRLLLEEGHEVQLIPVPEPMGSRLVWGLAPGRSVDVFPVMDFGTWKDASWLPAACVRLRPLPSGFRMLAYDAMMLVGLRRAIRSFCPDVIHNHLARAAFPRLARALKLHTPTVLTHHHGTLGESLSRYDRIVFPSQAAQRNLQRQSGYPAAQTKCIYNSIEPDFLSGDILPADQRSGIYFIGAVRERKGIDLLLEAYRRDTRLHAETLYVCGSGEDMALVEAAIREENLPIVREGRLSIREVASRVRRAKLVVIPSRMETLSNALVEAVCVGTPVVGWAPTVQELEQESGGKVGIAFDGRTHSARELANSIGQALGSPICETANRIRMSSWARETFTESKFVEGYLRLYRELISAGRSI
jgi:glycosyltransferase involved in cell wall biosynthesis